MSELIQLGRLWKRESKTGKVYYSGFLGDANILIMPNDRQTDEAGKNHDMVLMIGARKPKADA